MSEDFVSVEKSTLELIFKLAGIEMPENVDDEAIKNAILLIKTKQDAQALSTPSDSGDVEFDESYSEEDWKKELAKSGFGEKKKILIVDDIGVVTYQLKILFQKAGHEVETAKDIFSAIKLIKKTNFNFIIMDLFVSTEREGYLLLDETKKIIVQNNLDTKVVIITASNKGEHKVKCMNRGANMFLQKDIGWQDELVKFVQEN